MTPRPPLQRRARFSQLVLVLCSLGFVAVARAQTSITFDTRYTATNLSMWSGGTPTQINYNQFVGVQWDEKAGPYGSMTTGLFGEPWGLIFSAQTSDKIGFDVMFKSTSGTMNIDLPNTVKLDVPNLSGSGGANITVTQTRNLAPGSNIISSEFPNAQFSVGATLKVNASVTADIGYGFGRDQGTVTLSDLTKVAGVLTYNPTLLFVNPFDLSLPLISYNVNNSGKIALLGGLGGIGEKDLKSSFTFPLNTDTFTKVGDYVSLPTAVEYGSIRFRKIEMDAASGSSLTSVQKQDEVVTVNANLLGLVTLAAGYPVNPFEPKIYIPGTPLLVDATIVSVDAGISVGLRQTIELKPQTRLVLQSNMPVTYRVDGTNITTKYLDVLLPDAGGVSSVEIVSKPDSPLLQIYPSVYVSPVALNKVELGFTPDLTIEALKLGISAYGLGGGLGPLYKQILHSDTLGYISIFDSTINLANLDAFAKRYRSLDSLVNPGAAVGEDLAIQAQEYLQLRNLTQAFATTDIPTGAVLEMTNVGFNNTTTLSIATGGELLLKGGANTANVRGLALAAGSKVTVEAGSVLNDTSRRDSNGTAVVVNGHQDPVFIDGNGTMANGLLTLRGQMFYTGPDLKKIGSGAAISLIDNGAVGNGTLHLINSEGTPHDPLTTLTNLDGSLTLAGPQLTLTSPLTLGGGAVLDLQRDPSSSTRVSTLTAPGLLLDASSTTANPASVLLDHGASIDLRSGATNSFANLDSAGHFGPISLFLGDNQGGGQIKYNGRTIVESSANIVLAGAAPSGGFLARETSPGNFEEGLRGLSINSGTLALMFGAQLKLDNLFSTFNTVVVSGTGSKLETVTGGILNTGGLTVTAGGELSTQVFGNNTSHGVFELSTGGKATVNSLYDLTTPSGGIANTLGGGGTWNLGAQMDLGGVKINGLGASTTLVLRTPQANIGSQTTPNNAFSGFARNEGNFTVREGAQLTSTAALTTTTGSNFTVSGASTDATPVASKATFAGLATHNGTINVGTGGIFDTSGANTNNASLPVDGSNRLNGGWWNVGGQVIYTGAALTGIAANTTLEFMPAVEQPVITNSGYNTNSAGEYFVRKVTGGSPSSGPGLLALATINGTLTLNPNTSLRTDAALTINSGGLVTVEAKGTLQVTGATLGIASAGGLDLQGNLILGGAGSQTTFTVPDGYNFATTGEVQLGRVTSVNAVYDTTGSGKIASAGAWTNTAATIRGVGDLTGTTITNHGSIFAADGELRIAGTVANPITLVNSGRLGSLTSGAATTLRLEHTTVQNYFDFPDGTDADTLPDRKKGVIEVQANAYLSESTVNGGNIFVNYGGTLQLALSTLAADSLTVYGTLDVSLGSNYVKGDVDLGNTGRMDINSAGLGGQFGKEFRNYGQINIASGALADMTIVNNLRIDVSGTSTMGYTKNMEQGTITVANGGTLNFLFPPSNGTTFTNKGLIQLATEYPVTTPNAAASLLLWQDTTLVGGGAIRLGGYQAPITPPNYAQLPLDFTNGGSGTIKGFDAGHTLTNQENTIMGAGNIGGGNMTIVNGPQGYIHAMGSGRELVIQPDSGGFRNQGTLDVDSGATLRINGTFSSLQSGTFVEGNYRVAGTLVLPTNVGSFDNQVGILIDGANAKIAGPNGNNVAIKNNLSGGSFTIGSGYNYAVDASGANSFQNNGLLGVRSGSTFTITGPNFANFDAANFKLQSSADAPVGGDPGVSHTSFEIMGGTLKFTGAEIRTNATSLTLGGANPQIVNESNANALAGFASNAAGATLTIKEAGISGASPQTYTLPTTASFTNAGTLNVLSNSLFKFGNGVSTFSNPGTIAVSGNSALSFGVGTLSNTGTFTVSDTSSVNASVSTFYNARTIVLRDAATFTIPASVASFANLGGAGEVGTFRVGEGTTLRFGGNNALGLTGTGTSAVTTGKYEVAGTLKFDSGAITVLGTDLTLFGAKAKAVTSTDANALALTTVSASGKLTLGSAQNSFGVDLPNVTVLPLTTNNGTIAVGGSAVADGAGGTKDTGGALTLTSSSLTGSGTIKLDSRFTEASGSDPAIDSPATLTLSRATAGDFSLSSRIEGDGHIEIGGATTGLLVGATGSLVAKAGTLFVNTPVTNFGVIQATADGRLQFTQSLSLVGGGFDIAGTMAVAGAFPTTLPSGFNLYLHGAGAKVISTSLNGTSEQDYFRGVVDTRATISVSDNANLKLGNRTVNYGTLSLASGGQVTVDSEFTNYGTVTIDHGTFNTFGIFNEGTFRIAGTYAQTIRGAGEVRIIPSSEQSILFNSGNTYTGNTVVETGARLLVSGDSQLGARPGPQGTVSLVLNPGAELELNNNPTLSFWRTITYGDGATLTGFGTVEGAISGTGTLNIGDISALINTTGNINVVATGAGFSPRSSSAFGGDITGASNAKIVSNTAFLTLAKDYSFGGTFTTNGFSGLTLGDGGTTGSLANAKFVNNGFLNFNRTGNVTLGTEFTGGVGGTLTIPANLQATTSGTTNNYAGTTTIQTGGKLTLTGGTFSGNINNSGALVLSPAAGQTATLGGVAFATAGSTLRMNGQGTAILQQIPTVLASGLAIDSGTVQFGTGEALNKSFLDFDIVNNGTLAFNLADATRIFSTVSGTGGLTLLKGTLTIDATKAQTFSGGTTIKGGTLVTSADSAFGAVPASFQAANVTLDGGALTLAASTLNANRGITVASGGGTLNGSGTLPNPLGGTGDVTLAGSLVAPVATNDPHRYTLTGATSLDSGGAARTLPRFDVSAGATVFLTGNGTLTATQDSTIAGTGALVVLNGTANFTPLGTGTIQINAGATVNANGGQIGTVLGAGTFTAKGNFDATDVTATTVSSVGDGVNGGRLTVTGDYDVGTTKLVNGAGLFLGSTNPSDPLQTKTLVVDGVIAQLQFPAARTFKITEGLTNLSGGILTLNSSGTLDLGNIGTSTVAISHTGVLQFSNSTPVTIASVSNLSALKIEGSGSVTLAGSSVVQGTVAVDNGALILGNGGTTGSLSGATRIAVASGAYFGYNRSDNFTVDSTLLANVDGPGGLMQAGTGIMTLDRVPGQLSGQHAVVAGTLKLTTHSDGTNEVGTNLENGVLVSRSLDTSNNLVKGILAFDYGFTDFTFTGSLRGDGIVRKDSTNTLTLSGTQAFWGHINVEAGRLILTGANTGNPSSLTDNGQTTVKSGATLEFVSGASYKGKINNLAGGLVQFDSGNFSVGDAVSGDGGLFKTGTGTLTFLGAPTYAGSISVDSGSTLKFDFTGTGTITGILNGNGAITKDGFGTLILTGNNTFSGTTTIKAGTLQLGQTTYAPGDVDNARLFGTVNLDGGRLAFSRLNDFFGPDAITGSGGIIQRGVGKLTLTAANTYTGGTTIDAGSTLQLGAGNNTGSILIKNGEVNDPYPNATLVNNGTLIFNRADAQTIDGDSSGAGKMIQVGTGTLTLTGQHTNTGGLEIGTNTNAGTVATSTTVVLGTDATLEGPIKINNDGKLSVVTASGVTSREVKSAISGLGDLEVSGNGTLKVTGSLTHGGDMFLAGVDGTNHPTLNLNTVGTSQLDQRIRGIGDLLISGNGTLILTNDDNNFVGTTTVDAFATLQLGAGGATGNIGGVGGASLVNNGTLAFNRATDFFFNTAFTGSGGIRNVGAGRLIVSNGSSFAGKITVDQGSNITLQGTSGAAFTTVSPLVVDGGMTLQPNAGGITLWDLTGGISSSSLSKRNGSLDFTSVGTVLIDGALNYAGGITNAGGTVTIRSNGKVGNVHADDLNIEGNVSLIKNETGFFMRTTIAAGAALTLGDSGTEGTIGGINGLLGKLTNNGTLAINRNDAAPFTLSLTSPSYVGSGGLKQAGPGTTRLESDFSGPVEIAAGAFEVGANEFGGITAGGAIVDNAKLIINGGTAAGAISGTGSVEIKSNTALGGSLTYTGDTNIASGKSLAITADTLTSLPGGVSGGGSLTVFGGTLALPNGATYTGATSLGGTLRLGQAIATSEFNGSGVLELNPNTAAGSYDAVTGATFTTPIKDSVVVKKTGAGIATLTGADSSTGALQINAGTLRIAGAGALPAKGKITLADVAGALLRLVSSDQTATALEGGGSSGGNVDLGAQRLTLAGPSSGTYAGNLSGTGGLTLDGFSLSQTLSGNNTYTGATQVKNGTLILASATALAPAPLVLGVTPSSGQVGALEIAADVTLASSQPLQAAGLGLVTVDNGKTLTVNSVISGSRQLTFLGSGTVALNTLPTVTDGLLVSSRLQLNSSTIDYTGITLANGAVDLNGQTRAAALATAPGLGGTIANSAAGAAEFAGTFTSNAAANDSGFNPGLQLNSTGGGLRVSGTLVNPTTSTASPKPFDVITTGAGRVALAPTTAADINRLTVSDGTAAIESASSLSALTRLEVDNGRVEFSGGNATNSLTRLFIGAGPEVSSSPVNVSAGLINNTVGSTVRFDVTGDPNFGGGINFVGFNQTLLLGGAGDLYLAGEMGGNAGVAKIGGGKVTLDGGFSNWNGGIEVREGILAGAQALFSSRSVNVLAGAQIQFLGGGSGGGGNNDPVTLSELAGAGTVSLTTGGLTLTQNSDTTFSGGITGNGPFTRNGTGKLTLSGAVSTASFSHGDGTTDITGSLTTGAVGVSGGTVAFKGTTTLGSVAVSGGIASFETAIAPSQIAVSGGGVLRATGSVTTGQITVDNTVFIPPTGYDHMVEFTGAVSTTGIRVTAGDVAFTGSLAAAVPLTVGENGTLTVPAARFVSTTAGVTAFTGTVDTAGPLSLAGGVVTSNAGTITARSFGNLLDDNGQVLGHITDNASGGTVRLLEGAGITVTNNFTNNGTILVSGTGINGASNLNVDRPFGGSPRPPSNFIQAGGSLTLDPDTRLSVNNLLVHGGTVTLNGAQTGNIIVDGGLLKGSGGITGSTANRLTLSGGTFSPGNSPGTFTAANATFNPGGRLLLELNALPSAGVAGTNWDLLSLGRNLDVALSVTSATPFYIDVATLTSGNAAGALAGFDFTQNYQWDFVHAATDGIGGTGISNFDPTDFVIGTSGFANALHGDFSVQMNGATLSLLYTYNASAIPEPSTYAMLAGLGALALAAWRRRRLATTNRPA